MAPGTSRPELSSVSSSYSTSGDFSTDSLPPSYSKSYDSNSQYNRTQASTFRDVRSNSSRSISSSHTSSTHAKRSTGISDRQLLDLAINTEHNIQWCDILTRSPDGADSDRACWKRINDAGSVVVYSKQEKVKFAVLAVGVLPCSVPEIVRLLHSPDAESYLVSMEGLHGEDFKDGAFVHRANLHKLHNNEQSIRDEELMDLTVKSAIFNQSGWRHKHEKWSFLEATYRRDNGTCFEKLTTTLPTTPSSTFPSPLSRSSSDNRDINNCLHDVTTAFCVQPEDQIQGEEPRTHTSQSSRPSQQTRVHFYAEFTPSQRSTLSIPSLTRSSSASSAGKGIKQRLVMMARNCDRLLGLVRRRRLGVQVLVDCHVLSHLFSSPATRCKSCNKSIMLLAVKQCRLCGQCVCGECSHKHERETKVRGSQRILLEDVRVCDPCLDRIDRSDFSELNDTSLLGPFVYPNAPNVPQASTVLKDLLKDELIHADSRERVLSVMNVIKCVLDQEDTPLTRAKSMTSSARRPISNSRRRLSSAPPLSPTSMPLRSGQRSPPAVLLDSTPGQRWEDADYVDALEHLTVPQVPYHKAELATTNGRSYPVDASHPDKQMVYPMPNNETDRLRAVEQTHVKELINNSDELNIICELAAKEMDTYASMVTIIDSNQQQVVASNLDVFQSATHPRSEAFCSHTIMDDKPLLVPHPEADVRFHQIGFVKEEGIRYYCGFPIKSQDDTVIGALCCINKATVEMSETQFSAMQKLAKTASKVIQVHGRMRSASNASSNSVSSK